jgi:hypothetical protein
MIQAFVHPETGVPSYSGLRSRTSANCALLSRSHSSYSESGHDKALKLPLVEWVGSVPFATMVGGAEEASDHSYR